MSTSREGLAVLFAKGCAVSGALSAQNAAPSHNPVSAVTVPHQQVPPRQVQRRIDRRDCLRDTGSLIPPKHGRCLPVSGRSCSARELRDSEASSPAGALERQDTAISPGR